MRKFVYVSEMLIVRHLGTPNSGFNGCHCMRDPVLYRSMVQPQEVAFLSTVSVLFFFVKDFRVFLQDFFRFVTYPSFFKLFTKKFLSQYIMTNVLPPRD